MELKRILNILSRTENLNVLRFNSNAVKVRTSHGGIISVTHFKKCLGLKERFIVSLSTPDYKEPVKEYTIKSSSEYFSEMNDVYKILVEAFEEKQGRYF